MDTNTVAVTGEGKETSKDSARTFQRTLDVLLLHAVLAVDEKVAFLGSNRHLWTVFRPSQECQFSEACVHNVDRAVRKAPEMDLPAALLNEANGLSLTVPPKVDDRALEWKVELVDHFATAIKDMDHTILPCRCKKVASRLPRKLDASVPVIGAIHNEELFHLGRQESLVAQNWFLLTRRVPSLVTFASPGSHSSASLMKALLFLSILHLAEEGRLRGRSRPRLEGPTAGSVRCWQNAKGEGAR